ncbi:MAG: apolipoprotein N-acyltransferase [Bryobacteraceae bacterium]
MRRTLLSLALAVLSALLLILSVPKFDIAVLATVALVPLLVTVAREPRHLRRFLLGWSCGFVYWFGVCYWIQFVLAFHGNMGEVAGWAVFFLFALAKGLHFAVFGVLAGLIMNQPWALPGVAALWTGIERTNGTLGFAWFTLGNAGIDMGIPLRIVPFTGVYGISFAFAMFSAAIAVSVIRRARWELVWLVLPLSIYLLPALPRYQRGASTAVVVQPNISETEQWTQARYDDLVHRMTLASLRGALTPGQPKPDLIAWPEAPAPFYYEENATFRDTVNTLARSTRTPIVIGNVTRTANGAPLNSATTVSAEGQPVSRYDKIYLVPFGEFIPPFFGFVNRISSETGDFTPGSQVVVTPAGGHRFSTFICYESAFPHLVRRFVNNGAEVLLNISNDGYFGHLAGREQHLKIARMRAVENGRWVIRATNDGISAAIDPAGRITQTLPDHTEAYGRFRFNYESAVTPYTRLGDWFAWGCLAFGLVAAGVGFRVSRRRVARPKPQ